jgi:ankyrin repeat protein
MRAVSERNLARVKSVLAEGADPRYIAVSAHWFHPVLYAALPSRDAREDRATLREIIRALVDAGLALDPNDPAYAATMVNIVIAGNTEGLDLLLEAGADINARGPKGLTFLTLAASSADERLVRQMLAHGADACLTDEAGLTAAEHARRSSMESDSVDPKRAEMVAALLDLACSTRQPN